VLTTGGDEDTEGGEGVDVFLGCPIPFLWVGNDENPHQVVVILFFYAPFFF
jgi:hypothetical protein